MAFSLIEKGSITGSNNRGDIGHPLRVALDNGKYGEQSLFVSTDALGDEYISRTQEIKFAPKPNFPSTENKYFHSDLSNAFSTSKERTTSGTSEDAGECMTLSRRQMLEKEWRPCLIRRYVCYSGFYSRSKQFR